MTEPPTWGADSTVLPAGPDELVLDFSGEVHRIESGRTFVIGRGGDLDIDDNPYLHRRFLVFARQDGLWWVANEGSRLSATLTDGDGLVQSRLAPGARMPLVFTRVILTFSAGPTTYEIDLFTAGDHFTNISGPRQDTGQTTIGVAPMTKSQLLLVLALAEPVLKRVGTGAEGLGASAARRRRPALVPAPELERTVEGDPHKLPRQDRQRRGACIGVGQEGRFVSQEHEGGTERNSAGP